MKVAILTLPFNNNYGGFIQAYALQTVLEHLGHEVEIINKRYPYKYSWYHVFLYSLYFSFQKRRFRSINLYKYKGKKMHVFLKKYMHLSKMLYSDVELYNYCKKKNFNAIVVGSDQVWRPQYVPNIKNYFLCFLHDGITKKIAYAASFGMEDVNYTDDDIYECGKSLLEFSGISLRENEGLNVFKKNKWTSKNIKVVLDPTLLLNKTHYCNLVSKINIKHNYNGKIVTYILDINKDTEYILKETENILGIKTQNIIDPMKWRNEDYIMPAIEEWLIAFRDASYIVTDSFHGTVFSIIFRKPFISILNKDRGQDRFYTLLSYFNLENRIIDNYDSVKEIINKPIDWNYVEEVIEKKKNISLQFLKESLMS